MTTIRKGANLERANALSYMDLLAITLSQHEKTLGMLIERLEKISGRLDKISRQMTIRKREKRETNVKNKDAKNFNYVI